MSTERYNGPTPGPGSDPVIGRETYPASGSDIGPTSGYARPTSGGQGDLTAPVPDPGYGTAEPRHAADQASTAAGTAAQGARDVTDTTLEKVGESKDVLLERGGDVVAVARDEAADLAREAQAHLKSLWAQASSQFQEQASMAQKQVADLLHDLAGELGEMASKSEQHGPMTSFVRQAATRGGALSQWLSNAETGDVLVEVKRFARKRPMAFLAGAAVAGVLVGRLGRGLMAPDDSAAAIPTGPSLGGSTTQGAVPSSVYAPNVAPTAEATSADGSVDTYPLASRPYDGGPR